MPGRRIPTSETAEPLALGLESFSLREDSGDEATKGKTELKKELGLLEGVAIILGIIIGSGIFISPKGVLQETGSVGMSLTVWVLCGLLSMIGALCYAELGTSIPKSGGDYAYINTAFGSLPSFLFLWDANLIFVPTTNAIMGLTFAKYVIQPFFPDCNIPDSAVRLIAALSITFLTFINCWNVRLTTKLQDAFMVTKIGALLIVIIAGMVHLFMGNTQNFNNAFEGTSTEPGQIAVSFYSGIFSYAGWNYLNFMTEELKNPFVNLPRAIYISLPVVTLVYVLANVAYLAVLTPTALLASDAIAVTFADKLLSYGSWIMPILVALSAFGGLSVHIMTSSRLCFVGARQGHFPDCLALINYKCNTPTTSLVFLGLLSLMYLCTTDIYSLIEYASFVESMFILCSVAGLLYLRWKCPDMERPIKVNIIVPIVFLMICGFLVFLPLYVRPLEVGMGILITASGIPAYLICIYWKDKPAIITRALESLTIGSQQLFFSVKGD
ncbi:Y+L amino acid transporter 2-like [Homarus americanus]|uniref:Y+L amino acid transporter 2-like n=1 Tax=Homarus americanus TaxID=6706 RepID=UPI001C45DBE7|nr:Y+L amino acid transporter 2-like [Homarus americanus]XP_042241854.1 Y+L amino acid transporter 2-like [Homarus americanus]